MKRLIIVVIVFCIFQMACSKNANAEIVQNFIENPSAPCYDQAEFVDNLICLNICSPTAGAMLLGLYDLKGWGNMIDGSAYYVENSTGVEDLVDTLKDNMEYTCYVGVTEITKIREGIVLEIFNKYNANVHMELPTEFYFDSSDPNAFELLKREIDMGFPVILTSTEAGIRYGIYQEDTDFQGVVTDIGGRHSMVLIGYYEETDPMNTLQKYLILNSGWGGDKPERIWINYDALWGSGYSGLIFASRLHLYETGIYCNGWHSATSYQNSPSQPFLDAYALNGGKSVLGLPWDNGGTKFVHAYPNENSNDKVYIQDFLFTDSQNNEFWNLLVYNDNLDEVFPITPPILDFWWENSGYNTYGPPTEAAHSETDVNNNAIIVQGFQSGQYIGYCETTQFVGEVFLENGEYVQVMVAPQIDNIMSMIAVPSYICNGVDAYAYLGSSPDTEQPVVSIINPLNSSEMKNIIFLNSNARAKYFTILSDMNGNGFPEIHLTAYDVTNLGKLVEIRDSKTGAIIQ